MYTRGSNIPLKADQKKCCAWRLPPSPADFRCFEKQRVYVHANMNRISLLKRWRPRIRLPRRKPRKRLQQLELNLWQKRQQKH